MPLQKYQSEHRFRDGDIVLIGKEALASYERCARLLFYKQILSWLKDIF